MITEIDFKQHIQTCLTAIETHKFQPTNSTAMLSLRVVSAASFALCRDAYTLLENGKIYSSCSLVCQAIEAQIQLLCIDKFFNTNGKDYYEYAFVEQLRSLSMSPHWKDQTLQRMEQYNCDRFYKGKGDKTSIKSYHEHWYQSFANKIKDLSNIAFPHLKEIFHANRLCFIEEDLNIDLLYENYQTLCAFKHLSPFIVGDTFLVQNGIFEHQKQNHKDVALMQIYVILLSVILILKNHGEDFPVEDCIIRS